MKKDDYSELLNRYLTALEAGKDTYFDADEILYLLDRFEEDDDLTYYDGVLAVGLKLYPTSIDMKIKECRSLILNSKFEEALTLADKISEQSHQELDTVRLECYFSLKEYDTGYNYLTELIINPSCSYIEELIEDVTVFLNDMGFTEAAEDLITYALAGYPENFVLNNELCYLYELKGDIDEAIKLCNRMLDYNPYLYDFWFTLGRLHSIKDEYDKAIEAFDFASTCDKPDADLLILKAYCFFMNENYQKALDIYKALVSEKETNSQIFLHMAECHIKLDDYEPAYQLLRDIIYKQQDREAADATTYINYIHCCAETDRDLEASKMLIRATELFPDNVRILSLLALAYLESGRDDLVLSITDKIFQQLEKMKNEPTNNEHVELLQKRLAKFFRTLKPVKQLPFLFNDGKHIPPKDLAKEYINNKENYN